MRISTVLVVASLIGACYVAPAPPPPTYGPPPVNGPPRYSAAPAGTLAGQWRVTEVVPPGQPFAGTYTTTWEMTDSGGQLWASGVWSNGPRSRYAGSVQGGAVHFDRTDENGFRGAFDGSLSPDGNVMSGVGRNDPTSPGGNAAAYTWTAERIFAGTATAAPPAPPPPPAATLNLHRPLARDRNRAAGPTVRGDVHGHVGLTDSGGQLSGDGAWSIGPHGRYTGWRRGATIHLDRTDDSGFRGSFEGTVGPHGATMRGVGETIPLAGRQFRGVQLDRATDVNER